MTIDIARIIGNLLQVPQVGEVERVKEVTPGQEENKTKSSQFGEVRFMEKRKKGGKQGGGKRKHGEGSESKEENVNEEGDDPGHVDIVI